MTVRAFNFLTHDGGRPLTCGVIADRRREPVNGAPLDLDGLARLTAAIPGACAYGKVVVIDRHAISTFQATAEGTAAPVFCGNSTAAAIGCMGGSGDLRTRVHGVAGHPYQVHARIDGAVVAQTWLLPAATPRERDWRGRRVVFLPALNDYALVFEGLPEHISPEAARQELLGADPACKLAVVGAGPEPAVAFYNSNGRHGGAPQTGLATIALAARTVPWLAELFAGGAVSYETADGVRLAALPATSISPGGQVAVELPTVSVDIAPVAMEKVA
ncbi:MAG: hypothetical protein AB7O49_20660 [Sphingomonadales bacterium]